MDKTEIKKEESTFETRKETHRKKKKFFRNKQISKIFEEIFTSKSYTNSTIDINKKDQEEKKKGRNTKKFSINNILPPNISTNTTLVGKYELSSDKIIKEIKDMRNYDPLNLNLVKNIINEKSTIDLSSTNSNIKKNLALPLSNNNHFLPQIKLYKPPHFLHSFRKRKNLSEIFNGTKSNENINISNDDKFKKRNKLEITQAVKNFYRRKKEIGYSSVINKKNNKYYQLGRNSFNT